jgi:hypothetical protein
VGPGQRRQPDGVDVLLDGGLDDLLGCLMQPGVDDLVPGVAQRSGDHLGAAVVAVEARLGDEDASWHGTQVTTASHHPAGQSWICRAGE